MFKKYIITYSFFALLIGTINNAASQGIHLLNNSKIKITNGAYIVLNTSSTNGIKETGTGGAIISEGEDNRVKWNVGTAIGVYSIPFRDNAGVDIPLTINKTTSGTEITSGSFILSTFSTDAENSVWPSDVTNLDGGSGDNSYFTIDRFWIIDADDYSAKPDLTLTIGYNTNEILSPNTINETSLQAQRFNSSTNSWSGYGPAGTANIVDKTVSSINVSGSELYRSWTLVDNSSPLPIELIDFSFKCLGQNIQLNWCTASETNNELFLIEKTENLHDTEWEAVTTVNGAGNSNMPLNYSILDKHSHHVFYYRLNQIDYDGNSSDSRIITIKCRHSHKDGVIIYKNEDGTILQINANCDKDYIISLNDLSGRQLWTDKINVHEGHNIFVLKINDLLSSAIYLLVLKNDNEIIAEKIHF